MMAETFKAVLIEEKDGKVGARVGDMPVAELPANEVTVRVSYSTVNYKDGLAVTNKGKIIRKFPMAAGIDFVGTVTESQSAAFKSGDKVILNGWGVGERYWGGFAQVARAKASWLVKLPAGLSEKQAMAIGTAGYTAMLCVMGLQDAGVKPEQGEVLVTGAAGGVGSVAIAILRKLGFTVVASTGRASEEAYLKSLGTSAIIDRNTLSGQGKPLDAERWAGAVDSVAGPTLANVLSQTKYLGAVAACGLAGGNTVPASVFPFILRGVKLIGIDSVMCPQPRRQAAWERLAKDLPLDKLDAMTTVHGLSDVPKLAEEILAGKVRGRAVIDVNA
jgi:acrylyl-CoA reductase (NADPH)